MLPKIALGNVRKSLRDFSVFFITLVFGVCVFYAFASINDQTAVIDLNELQSEAVATVTRMLSGVSVFVAASRTALLVWLVIAVSPFGKLSSHAGWLVTIWPQCTISLYIALVHNRRLDGRNDTRIYAVVSRKCVF